MLILNEYRARNQQKFIFLQKHSAIEDTPQQYSVKVVSYTYFGTEEEAQEVFQTLVKKRGDLFDLPKAPEQTAEDEQGGADEDKSKRTPARKMPHNRKSVL